MKQGAMGLIHALQSKRIIHLCLGTFFILAYQPISHSAEEESLPWKISADQIIHQQNPEKIIAEGDVILQQFKEDKPTGLEIEADRLQYNVDTNSVDAVGNLHLRDKYDEVQASEAQINVVEEIGFFKDATIFWQGTKLTASADLIEKTDLKSYHFVNGKLTTCPPDKEKSPDWSIWGRDVEITLNDYAKLKHATFRVKDVPVFYLPYLRIPIRSDKKSGPSIQVITRIEVLYWQLNSATLLTSIPGAPSWSTTWMTNWRIPRKTISRKTGTCAQIQSATGSGARPIMILATGWLPNWT
jgi:lipopolysaccharide assembly outer membrane protein LptD (OstA)